MNTNESSNQSPQWPGKKLPALDSFEAIKKLCELSTLDRLKVFVLSCPDCGFDVIVTKARDDGSIHPRWTLDEHFGHN